MEFITLHPWFLKMKSLFLLGAPVLELDEEYWTIRDSILQMELLIIRMLNFSTAITHPHKYLLHYMKSLQEWFGVTTWNTMPVAKVAAGYLQVNHLRS